MQIKGEVCLHLKIWCSSCRSGGGVGVFGAVAEGAGVYGSFGGSIVVVKQHGSDEGVERPLGAVDLVVTDMGLFKGRDGNLDEELEILNGVEAKGVDIIDLDDTIEREVQRWSEGSPRRLARVRAE